jgi:hypothetical protein
MKFRLVAKKRGSSEREGESDYGCPVKVLSLGNQVRRM